MIYHFHSIDCDYEDHVMITADDYSEIRNRIKTLPVEMNDGAPDACLNGLDIGHSRREAGETTATPPTAPPGIKSAQKNSAGGISQHRSARRHAAIRDTHGKERSTILAARVGHQIRRREGSLKTSNAIQQIGGLHVLNVNK